jgi:UDP-glucuronate decarboxylase
LNIIRWVAPLNFRNEWEKFNVNIKTSQRILVTGGAGFLGSHLIDRLLLDGHSVICLDNLYTGSRHNIAHLAQNPRVRFVEHDITQPIEMDVDAIYNLACPASPVHYQADPVKTLKTSVLGALNVLDLARANKARVFQASTSEVYGDPEVHPQPESYWGRVNPHGIRSCYDEGKRCAETLFFDYYRKYGVDIKIVRIFNTYGPRMHPEDGRVVSNFIVQALKGEDLTVYGNGEQTRSFCYADDLIDGFVRLMESSDDIQGPMNMGNPHEFSMLELAEKVLAIVGSSSKLKFLPLPQDDPKQRCPDIGFAKRALDWQPRIQLEEGLARTVSYFRSVQNEVAGSREFGALRQKVV